MRMSAVRLTLCFSLAALPLTVVAKTTPAMKQQQSSARTQALKLLQALEKNPIPWDAQKIEQHNDKIVAAFRQAHIRKQDPLQARLAEAKRHAYYMRALFLYDRILAQNDDLPDTQVIEEIKGVKKYYQLSNEKLSHSQLIELQVIENAVNARLQHHKDTTKDVQAVTTDNPQPSRAMLCKHDGSIDIRNPWYDRHPSCI